MSKPTSVHMGAVKRILRYLRGTPDIRITYSRNSSFELTGFCYASYGTGNPEKVRSTSGSIYPPAGGVIHFSASVQKISALSTTEAELVAMSSCAKQGIYLCGILGELGWRTFRSARIFCDNKSALLLAGQGSYSSRSKHVAIRFADLRDWITDDKIIIDHVSMKGQLSDILTKFLARPLFTEM
ncbi:unnamed protein product, partial [Sphacelaria rigidula]